MLTERDLRHQAPTVGLGKIEAVATAAAIVDLLAERETKVGVQDVANWLGLTKSRASRHLANLEQLGIVARSDGGRGYELGWRLVRWGGIAARRSSIGEMLHEQLAELAHELELTVLLSTEAGGDAIVVKCVSAPQAIHIDVRPGSVLSLPHSPTARVVFAFQSRERRAELLRQLSVREETFRVENSAEFVATVAVIQQSYYCWTRDKFDIGHGAVAAPVFDGDEHLAAVITVMIPSERLQNGGPPAPLVRSLLRSSEHCGRRLKSRLRLPGI